MSDSDDVELINDNDPSTVLKDTMTGLKTMKYYVSYSRFYRTRAGQWFANAALFTGFIFLMWLYGAEYVTSCEATFKAGDCPWVSDTTYAKGCALTTHTCGWAQSAAKVTQYHILAIPFYTYFGVFFIAAGYALATTSSEASAGIDKTKYTKYRDLLTWVLFSDAFVCAIFILSTVFFCEFLGARDTAITATVVARDTAITAFIADVGATSAQTVALADALLLVAAGTSATAKSYYLSATILGLIITGLVLVGHSYRVTNSESISEAYGIGNARGSSRESRPLVATSTPARSMTDL